MNWGNYELGKWGIGEVEKWEVGCGETTSCALRGEVEHLDEISLNP